METGFDDIIDGDIARMQLENIRRKTVQILDENKPVVVLPLQRKGYVIFRELEDRGAFDSIPYSKITESEYSSALIEGRNILVFDDSARTGMKAIREIEEILVFHPKRILFFPLLINERAIANVSSLERRIEVSTWNVFKNYEEQQEFYKTVMLSVMDIIKRNLNNQFIVSDIELEQHISLEELKSIVESIDFGVERFIFDNITDIKIEGAGGFSVLFPMLPFRLNDPWVYENMTDIDFCQVRFYLPKRGAPTAFTFVPMVAPIFSNVHKCHNDYCFYEGFRGRYPQEQLCMICLVQRVNEAFFEKIRGDVLEELRKQQLNVTKEETTRPTRKGLLYGHDLE